MTRPLRASRGSFKELDNSKLLLISGSRGFAESLFGYSDDGSRTEDGLSILAKAEKKGWKIADLSKMKVCTRKERSWLV